MATTMLEIMNPCLSTASPPGFPNAPADWTEETARSLAKTEELELGADHWEVIRDLQSYFCRSSQPNARELNDALDEKFHAKGGVKYLYEIFPGGPIVQGSRLAGLGANPGLSDKS